MLVSVLFLPRKGAVPIHFISPLRGHIIYTILIKRMIDDYNYEPLFMFNNHMI